MVRCINPRWKYRWEHYFEAQNGKMDVRTVQIGFVIPIDFEKDGPRIILSSWCIYVEQEVGFLRSLEGWDLMTRMIIRLNSTVEVGGA
jgi:hypothetical protein